MTSSPLPPLNSSPPFILHISDVASQIFKKKTDEIHKKIKIMFIKICSYGIGNFLLAIAITFKGRKERMEELIIQINRALLPAYLFMLQMIE